MSGKPNIYRYTKVVRHGGVRRAVVRIKTRSWIKYLFHRAKAATAAKKGRSYEYDDASGLRTYANKVKVADNE